jgi:hypothetical protein
MGSNDLNNIAKDLEKYADIAGTFKRIKNTGHLGPIYRYLASICGDLDASYDRNVKEGLKLILNSAVDEVWLKLEKERI